MAGTVYGKNALRHSYARKLRRGIFHTSPDLRQPTIVSPQLLDTVLASLRALDRSDFAETLDSFPQPYAEYPNLDAVPFELPSVLVPPEIIELDGLSADSGDDAYVKKEEWPEYHLRLFDNDVSILIFPIRLINLLDTRSPQIQTLPQAMLCGQPYWTPLIYSKSIEKNVHVSCWNILNGSYLARSSPNLVHLSKQM
jgi:hypothetical protein